MANLLSILRRRTEIVRLSQQDYLAQLATTPLYPFQSTLYSVGRRPVETVPNSYLGYAEAAYASCTVVGACMRVRRDIFSQARFTWRERTDDGTGSLSYDDGLDLLARPWPNGTTGQLLTKMITDVDLCGNAYVVNEGDRLRWRRPDWMFVVLSGDPNVDDAVDVLGYVYTPGGCGLGEGRPYTVAEVAHWAPIPRPGSEYIGMSWMTSALREIQADKHATDHKLNFFVNGATLGPVFRLPATMTAEQFKKFRAANEEAHVGVENAYRPLYIGGGAEVTLSAATFQQLELKATQGAGESRIASNAGIHPTIAGFSEGLAGSSLNAGNFTAARRLVADITLHKLWQDACDTLASFVEVPDGKELWIRESAIPFLREDAKDAAEIFAVDAQSATVLVREGYEPESVTPAVAQRNVLLLKHSGALSVQLQEPGAQLEQRSQVIDGEVVVRELTRRFDPSQPRDPHGRWSLVGFVSHLLGSVGEARVWHDPEEREGGPSVEVAVGSADYLHDWDEHITAPWKARQHEDESREVDFFGEELADLHTSLGKAADAAAAGRRYHEEHYGSDHGLLVVDSDGTAVTLSNHYLSEPDQFEDEAAEQLEDEAWQAHWAARPPSDEDNDDEDEWTPSVTDAQIKARSEQLLAKTEHPQTVLTPDQARRLAESLAQASPEASRAGWNPAEHPRNPRGTPGGGRFRSVAARILDALDAWENGDRKPLKGFNREQLRQEARRRGIRLRRGESLEEIRDKLLAGHRKGSAGKAAPEAPRPRQPQPSRPRSRRDGLDAMDDRDLHDLAVEYGIPPVGLGTADRAALIGRLRTVGATAPGSGVQASRRPTVGLRVSLLLNTWSNGDGPDDPLETGFTREQLRQAARSRNISLPRGASEHTIRQALYDSVRGPARQRRASVGSLTPMGDLFGPRMNEVERTRRVKEIFEGDFGGLTTVVDSVYRDRYRSGGTVSISVRGRVLDSNGYQVGSFSRQYGEAGGRLTAYHAYLQISGSVQGNGFSNAFNGHLINWYRHSGVESVSVHANIDVGGYTWASFGYDFADESDAVTMADRFRRTLRSLETTGGYSGGRRPRGAGMQTADQVAALRTLLARVDNSRFGQPGYPTAYEFSQAGRWPGAGGRRDVWIGKALMLGTSWHGRLDLTSPSPTGP